MKKKPDEGHIWADAELEKLERRIAAEYKKAADELTDKINAYFESFKKRDEETKALIGTVVNGREYTRDDYLRWRAAQMGRADRFEALRDRCLDRSLKAREVADAYTRDATAGIYSLNRNYAAYTIEQVAGDVGFDLWDEQTVKRLLVEEPALMPAYSELIAKKYKYNVDEWRKGITRVVTQAAMNGKSIKGIADDLRDRVGITDRNSAIRAARTAVTGAQNAGRQDSYDAAVKMGIEMEKQWLATLDGRTRHDHAVADGQTVAEDKPFIVGGYKLMFPGDMASGAPGYLLYNCRCSMIAKVKGVDMSDALRRDRWGVLPNMTFAQWENTKRGEGALASERAAAKEAEREKRDRKQYKEYKEILGKDVPRSFKAFQDLKYNDPDKWKDLKSLRRKKGK